MPRSAARPVVDLPVPVTRFIGRRTELAQLRRRLEECRLVTLTGVGGVGKTRLAIEAARAVGRAFAGGVRMVDLSAVADPGQVAQTVVSALGVVDRSTRRLEDKLVDHLGDRELLLVLDNCEHVVDACAALVAELLGRTHGLRVLATSRRTLRIPGEHLFAVPPLAVPESGGEEATGGDAVQLLVDRARALRPGFEVTPANRLVALRLCARLDGLPLAIELAASRLRTLTLEQLVDRLEGRFALLTTPNPVADPRQRTLRAVMDWSHSLCAESERLLWARLSVFAGGFDLEAAEAVCAGTSSGGALDADQVLDLLDRLVAQSIVLSDSSADGLRFRLLETIREYGRERLADLGEGEDLRRRHRDHYLEVARAVARGWCTPRQRAGLARLRAEHGNLRAALEAALGDPDAAPVALSLTCALRHHWYADAFLGEGRAWLDQALALPAPAGRDPQAWMDARVDALWVAAWVSLLQGDEVIALQRLDECVGLAVRLGDERAAGFAASLRGTARLFAGDLPAADAAFAEAVTGFERLGETEGLLWVLFQQAIARSHQGDGEAAQEICRRSVALSERLGENLCHSYALWVLAYDTWRQGDAVAADRQGRRALALHQSFNDPVGAGLVIELLSWVAATRDDLAAAARLQGTADSVWALIGTTLRAFGPPLQRYRDACTLLIDAGLDDAAARAHRERGRRTTIEAALSSVLEPGPSAAQSRPGPSAAESRPGPAALPPLTGREAEVARLLAEGLSNRAIASRLVISQRTVDGHVERILAKLGFTARTQVAAWIATCGAAGVR